MSVSGLLAHRVAGEGPPVLLLNGGLMTMSVWDEVAAPLSAGHRVVRCDFRGQLLSPGTPPVVLEGHVEDLACLLDALGLGRVHVVGTSFGAFVGLRLAATRPERVASLVAATAAERVTQEAWKSALAVIEACDSAAGGGEARRVFDLLAPGTFSPRYVAEHPGALAERRERIAALPPAWFAALAGLLRSLEGLDLRRQLGCIRCPTLVLAAEQDHTFPRERSEALAAAIPGAALQVVPSCGHALVVEAPGLFLEAVQCFLSRITGTEASS